MSADRLFNQCNRPVELHLAGGAVVIPPWEDLSVSDDDAQNPQVLALCSSGVLALQADEDDSPPDEAAVAEETAGSELAADGDEATAAIAPQSKGASPKEQRQRQRRRG